MKAIVYDKFGPPEVLELKEVEKPIPKDNEILVKVHATPVTYGEIIARNSKNISPRKFNMPFLFWLIQRLDFGFRKPKKKILGSEFAGKVESIGKDVKLFKKGEEVFGYLGPGGGANAEFVSMPEDGRVALKPTNMTYEEASTVPFGAMTASNLLKKINIQKGQKVLINGASGGIGSFAVQLAKNSGAEVTGVCSTSKLDYVKSLGADKIIDYTQEDFTKSGETYDVIFDILVKSSFSSGKKSLEKNGRYLYASFKTRKLLQMLRTSIMGKKKVICAISMDKTEDLIAIKELIETGKIKSIIDRSFTVDQAAEAHDYVEKGLRKGHVVITFDPK